MRYLSIIILTAIPVVLLSACSNGGPDDPPPSTQFSNPELVTITGYNGDVMEPFISRDGGTLFFNDAGGITEKDIFYANFVDSTTFAFQGPISEINTPAVDGVPTMDDAGQFYYVSTANYNPPTSYDTLYSGSWTGNSVTGINAVANLATPTPGFVNFDIEVSADGTTVYFNEGDFRGGNAFPDADTIIIAEDYGSGFVPLLASATILANVNTSDLEYAVAISRDDLELFFTRLELATLETSIYRTSRNSVNDVFEMPQRITAIVGFVEGATLSPDEKSLYYHRKNPTTNNFELYRVTRASK